MALRSHGKKVSFSKMQFSFMDCCRGLMGWGLSYCMPTVSNLSLDLSCNVSCNNSMTT